MIGLVAERKGFVPRHGVNAALAALRLLPALLVLSEFIPGVAVLFGERVLSARGHGLAVAVLVVLIVLANLTLVRWPVELPPRVSEIGLLVFVVAGSTLLLIRPTGLAYVLPFWAARVAVRYQRPGGVGTAAIVLSVIGAALPTLVYGLQLMTSAGIAVAVIAMTLAASNRRGREERLEQAELLLARKQAAAEEHARAGALAERARIAREMHDVLAHSLAGLSLTLQGARLMLQRDNAAQDVMEQVTKAQRLAADGLAEARRAVAALREDKVPDARAIADLVTAFRLESGSRAELTINGTPRDLPAEMASALYRTTQEALTNARKYAPGAPVNTVLDYEDGRTVLTVTDHPGRPPSLLAGGGYGLLGMRERAELIGGELETGPMEDGWRVRLVVPA